MESKEKLVLGLLFALNQMLYILIAMRVYAAAIAALMLVIETLFAICLVIEYKTMLKSA